MFVFLKNGFTNLKSDLYLRCFTHTYYIENFTFKYNIKKICSGPYLQGGRIGYRLLHGFYIRWLLISPLRTNDDNKVFFWRKKIGFDDSFDVTKCLQQIEIPDLLQMCAQWNKQPSNLQTMDNPEKSAACGATLNCR